MPVNNVTKEQDSRMPGGLVQDPVPNDAKAIVGNISDFTAATTQLINMGTASQAAAALDAGEQAKAQDAISLQNEYGYKLAEAASAQDVGTMLLLQREASKIKQAQAQNLLSPSVAQVRLNALAKGMSYNHPHLSAEISGAITAAKSNVSTLLSQLDKDPSATMLNSLVKTAAEQGFTVEEYMSFKRAENLAGMQDRENDMNMKLFKNNSAKIILGVEQKYSMNNASYQLEVLNQITEQVRAAGMLPNQTIAAFLETRRNALKEQRISEWNQAILDYDLPIDYDTVIKSVDRSLQFMDDMVEHYASGAGTMSLENQRAYHELNKSKLEFRIKTDGYAAVDYFAGNTAIGALIKSGGEATALNLVKGVIESQILIQMHPELAPNGEGMSKAAVSWLTGEQNLERAAQMNMLSMGPWQFGALTANTAAARIATGDAVETPDNILTPEQQAGMKGIEFELYDKLIGDPQSQRMQVQSWLKDRKFSAVDLANGNRKQAFAVIDSSEELQNLLVKKSEADIVNALGDSTNSVFPSGARLDEQGRSLLFQFRPTDTYGAPKIQNPSDTKEQLKANRIIAATYAISPAAGEKLVENIVARYTKLEKERAMYNEQREKEADQRGASGEF